MKAYAKLASGMMITGMGLAALERMAAGAMAQSHLHLPGGTGLVMSAMVIAPLALIGLGMLVFVGGAILGLK